MEIHRRCKALIIHHLRVGWMPAEIYFKIMLAMASGAGKYGLAAAYFRSL
jgi:hypothetical protein